MTDLEPAEKPIKTEQMEVDEPNRTVAFQIHPVADPEKPGTLMAFQCVACESDVPAGELEAHALEKHNSETYEVLSYIKATPAGFDVV